MIFELNQCLVNVETGPMKKKTYFANIILIVQLTIIRIFKIIFTKDVVYIGKHRML